MYGVCTAGRGDKRYKAVNATDIHVDIDIDIEHEKRTAMVYKVQYSSIVSTQEQTMSPVVYYYQD